MEKSLSELLYRYGDPPIGRQSVVGRPALTYFICIGRHLSTHLRRILLTSVHFYSAKPATFHPFSGTPAILLITHIAYVPRTAELHTFMYLSSALRWTGSAKGYSCKGMLRQE